MYSFRHRWLALGVLLLCWVSQGVSQTPRQLSGNSANVGSATPPSNPVSAPPNPKQGLPLSAGTVNDNVRVQAVLLPYDVARRAFGKEIADKYASIELVISNKSADASFILHDIFLDYRHWGLSGIMSSGPTGIQPHFQAGSQSGLETTQTSTLPGQVACTEYRIVRSEMLDAQQWSARNWTVRSFVLVGSILSGISFTASEDWAKGISAFNGTLVPGVPVLWPDGAVQQLNTISDVGFRTNKVIPRQASDVVVCYYPINRFLPPGFIGIFKNAPALFFNPLSVLLDSKAFNQAKKIVPGLKDVPTADIEKVMKHPDALTENAILPTDVNEQNQPKQPPSTTVTSGAKTLEEKAHELGVDPNSLAMMRLLQTVSLNNIHLIVDGIMTVDVNLIPAQITAILCDDQSDPATFWSAAGQKKCTAQGMYLSGGQVAITNSDNLGITEIKADPTSSTDKSLNFTFKLSKAVPSQTVLEFKIVKQDKDASGASTGNNITSMSFLYPVSYSTGQAMIDSIKEDQKGIVTVSGKNFFDTTTSRLAVSLRPIAAKDDKLDVKIATLSETSGLPATFTFDSAASKAPSGCYFVVVSTGSTQPAVSNEKNEVKVPPNNDCSKQNAAITTNPAATPAITNSKSTKERKARVQ